MTFLFDTFPTPFGEFSAALDASGALAATAFGPVEILAARLGPGDLRRDRDALRAVCAQLTAYFAGARREFDLRIAPRGTSFQQRVWTALRRIPCGETRSYGQLAAELGNPAASRAVGRANATNPICVVVPCHRVIGADGSLTGFAFGEDIKRRLLQHERGGSVARPERLAC